jgi:hypothetical protein
VRYRVPALAIALLLLAAGPARGSDEAARSAIERENERRAKAGLLPRKEPGTAPSARGRPAASAQGSPVSTPLPPAAPSFAGTGAGARSAASPPRLPGPLEAAVAAGRGLSPSGAYGGPELAVDETLSGTAGGLTVRSAVRVRAGDLVLTVERSRPAP